MASWDFVQRDLGLQASTEVGLIAGRAFSHPALLTQMSTGTLSSNLYYLEGGQTNFVPICVLFYYHFFKVLIIQ